ncbi:LPS export ABC transporter periplasmic protein LptC [Rhodoblastus sp.]|uniref:LPS export ABC transporter periplasmic protein LptC n=1 Tax=Rhodoblastus sp. TaxID=1962975 RepID=UPI003F96EAE3
MDAMTGMGRALAQGGNMQADRTGPSGKSSRAVSGRTRAFRSAARHSARVKWLRRLIFAGAAVTSIGVVWYSWFRTRDVAETHISLESFGISSDKVTMERPRMTGVRRDGRPYEVTADTGVQHPGDPNRTDLTNLDARLRLSDDGETRVLGEHGLYDSAAQTLDLSGHVHIKGATYDLAMQTGAMNFKTNALSSNDPVRLDFDGGWVSSDRMTMTPNGEQIIFIGNVHSMFNSTPEQGPAPSDRKNN